MRNLAHLVKAATVAVWMAGAGLSSAQHEPTRILVSLDAEAAAARSRLRAELAALGFEMVEHEAGPIEPSHRALENAARDANAVAAMSITCFA